MSRIKNNSITSYTVEEEIHLLPFLLKTLDNKSRNAVKSILTRGQVSVDGHIITQHNHPLSSGQTIGILSNQASIRLSELNGVNILYEDDVIIVINKEAGILSMAASRSKDWDAYRQLTDYVKKEKRDNRIYIVHRLDRDTSGVMVYAKTEAAKEKLQKNWHDVVKERTYTALVEGNVEKQEGTISSWLKENQAMKVYSTSDKKEGKHAVTHYKKIDGNQSYTLLEVELETGRKNQIRVHMQDIGHPIVGDKKYGSKSNPIRRLGLHATTLAFYHPTTDKLVRYTVKAPDTFTNLIS
ncbi:RluA family pseudouridine synthase [Carnobacteriaceae bacterium 52-44]